MFLRAVTLNKTYLSLILLSPLIGVGIAFENKLQLMMDLGFVGGVFFYF